MKVISFLLILIGGLFTPGMMRSLLAQVTSDGTTNTTVNTIGNNFNILDGMEKGNNLFHSFSNFSVPTGGSANFDLVNTPNITTIFSRVTGGNISNIDGLIRTLNSSNPVSLFLINPAGILFGPNASLNISGSFVGTTANSIKFADGTEFNTSSTTPSLLTMSVPIGLQFGSNPKPIQVQGNGFTNSVPSLAEVSLTPADGHTLALIGGDVTMNGGVLGTVNGRLEVGSIGSNEMVGLTTTPTNITLNYDNVKDFGNISLGNRSSLINFNSAVNPLGGMYLNGGNLTVERSQIVSLTSGTAAGSPIVITAPQITVTDSGRIGSDNLNAGAGGNVNIRTGELNFRNGGQVSNLTGLAATGTGGKIVVEATKYVNGTGVNSLNPQQLSGISTQSLGTGRSGDITLTTPQLTLENGASITTDVQGSGPGGDITVDVSGTIQGNGIAPLSVSKFTGITTNTFGPSDAGNIQVSAEKIILKDGFVITSLVAPPPNPSVVSGAATGNAGKITVNSRESIELIGISSLAPSDAASSIGSITLGSGKSSDITISTTKLILRDGAYVSSGVGLIVPRIFQFLPNISGQGKGGNLVVNASDAIEVIGYDPLSFSRSIITTLTLASGNAGNMTINTRQLNLQNGGLVDSFTTGSGNSGRVIVNATDAINIQGTAPNGPPSGLGASGLLLNPILQQVLSLPSEPSGNTGEVVVNTRNLNVTDGGRVSVQHEGKGNAGTLQINANTIRLSNRGKISASTKSGEGGNINLQVQDVLLMRQSSLISSESGGTGNGGNITINAPTVIAVPSENSDIIANAVTGKGGNIQITTQGLLGLEFRPQLTSDSDITASSQFGVSGTVQINNIGLNPNSGLVELPANVTDPSQQIATGCAVNQSSSFVATGRGGIPQNPNQQVIDNRTWSDIRDISGYRKIGEVTAQIAPSSEVLVQATGWHRNSSGKIEIFADKFSAQTQQTLTCAEISR